ncbi:MAG: HesA/MoeB/ThiF family protein [Coriobacteriales bacterium]|jgi:adenylyltransferase/sulfurtransferase|nr:HesA/MoeB/ThiF family protein [Coriobacteriales bacterium]
MIESRYIRQEIMPQIGESGQALLAQAQVAIVGLGALGSVSSEILARSGVGYLRLIDRDVVELSNLQRCALYTEEDANAATSKALAARDHLKSINSTIYTEPQVCEVNSSNVLKLLSGVDLILDGSDNFEVRALINEAANKLGIPWIYTGVLGALSMVMPILPGGPCLRCLSPTVPEPGSYPTCTTNGVLPSTTRIAATLQATQALKLLLNKPKLPSIPLKELPTTTLYQIEVWEPEFEMVTVEKNPACAVCGLHHYELLENHDLL